MTFSALCIGRPLVFRAFRQRLQCKRSLAGDSILPRFAAGDGLASNTQKRGNLGLCAKALAGCFVGFGVHLEITLFEHLETVGCMSHKSKRFPVPASLYGRPNFFVPAKFQTLTGLHVVNFVLHCDNILHHGIGSARAKCNFFSLFFGRRNRAENKPVDSIR